MNDFRIVLLGYVVYFLVSTPIMAFALTPNPEDYHFLEPILGSMVFNSVFLLPFGLVTYFAFRKKGRFFLRSLSLGFVFLFILVILPAMLASVSEKPNTLLLLYAAINLIIGSYLVYNYRLSKGLLFLVLFFGPIANIYILVYGKYSLLKKTVEIDKK